MTSDDLTQRCLSILERSRPRAAELGLTERALEIRTTEFLLLMTRLRRRQGLGMGSVLEVGCGTGYSLLLWAQVAERVTGCDVEEQSLIAHKWTSSFEDVRSRVNVLNTRAEELGDLVERFDLVVTQYVLEHLADLDGSLRAMNSVLTPAGHVLHLVPGLTDRADWYIGYRLGTPWYRRASRALRERGVRDMMRGGLGRTPPHAPEFGDFGKELAEYRLERWSYACLRAGYEIVDYFPTRDVNWAILTRRSG